MGGHLLLDYTNAYGVPLLLPFTSHWYAWDIMPILDLILLSIFAAGLGLPALLRLVSEEVGSEQDPLRRGAIFALTAMVLLWGLRDFSHRRALAQLGANNYEGRSHRRGTEPFPSSVPSPGRESWKPSRPTTFWKLTSLASAIDAGHTETLHKPESSPALDAAFQNFT